jgi:hypothetical protein
MARLREAIFVDPLAEWKYHFDCTQVPDPIKIEKMETVKLSWQKGKGMQSIQRMGRIN